MTKIATAVRRELVRVLRERYREGARDERRQILEELVRLSGYHRKHAITVLNGRHESTPGSDVVARRGRPCLYDEAVRQALIVLWEASDRVCGKRLKAAFPLLISALESHGHLLLDATVRAKVMSVSAASIDRLLSSARSITTPRPRRLASALRKSVPVRTFSDWNDPLPGSMEADLVVHCGDTIGGSFVYTLTLTDIASGWTECVPLVVRESNLVTEAIEALRPLMPFPLRALDTDNGTNFLTIRWFSIAKSAALSLRARDRTARTIKPGSSRKMARLCVVWLDIGDSKVGRPQRLSHGFTPHRGCS